MCATTHRRLRLRSVDMSTAAVPRHLRRALAVLVALAVAAACTSDGSDESAPSTTRGDGDEVATADVEDRAYYILPPGNYGGLPTTDDSLDQLALYDGLTPLRGEVTDDDIESCSCRGLRAGR